MPSPTIAASMPVGPLTPNLFRPTAERPLRAKQTLHEAETRVWPHSHPWAQLAWSATGVMRITAGLGTYLVPPSRAVWIPPGIEHAVTVVETAEMRTLYLHQSPGRCGPGKSKARDAAGDWQQCRVLEVSDLLRALMLALPHEPDGGTPPSDAELQREKLIAPLLADELQRAAPVPLGVALPEDRPFYIVF